MSTKSVPGTTSVIVPCWNQLDYTRSCISALLHHTRPPWELIVIDNGSTDGTAAYLADVRETAPLPVTVIANTKNLGFPAAINQGLECARGEYLVMLNNDAVVTEGWLEQLVGVASIRVASGSGTGTNAGMFTTEFTENTEGAEARQFRELKNEYPGRDITVIDLAPESKIGLVGPMSNYAAPPQLVEDVPYRDLNEMHVFARRWRDEHRGKWMRVAKLSGFCLLMTRAVYEAVGGLDSGLDWGSSMMTTWPSGRGGLGSSWRSHVICSSITSAAGRSWAMGSMRIGFLRRTRRSSRPSGGMLCRKGAGWRCGVGRARTGRVRRGMVVLRWGVNRWGESSG